MHRHVGFALLGVVAIAIPGCTSIMDVPDPPRATALCVAKTLEATPNVEHVDVVVRRFSDGPSVLVRYNFHFAHGNTAQSATFSGIPEAGPFGEDFKVVQTPGR